jgi:hypothetical protein
MHIITVLNFILITFMVGCVRLACDLVAAAGNPAQLVVGGGQGGVLHLQFLPSPAAASIFGGDGQAEVTETVQFSPEEVGAWVLTLSFLSHSSCVPL